MVKFYKILCLSLVAVFSMLQSEAQITITVGTGTTANTTTSYPAPYGNFWWGVKQQYLVRASEIFAAGGAPGVLTSLAFDVTQVSTAASHENFAIAVGGTSDSVLNTAAFYTGLTPVFSVAAYTETVGWNTHAFSTNYFWNGVDNLIIEVCFNNSSYFTNAISTNTDVGYVSSMWFNADAAGVCAQASPSSTFANSTSRPNMQMGFLPATGRDAALTALISPASFVTGANLLTARVQSLANDPISSVDLGYQLDTFPPVLENGVIIPTPLSPGQTYNHTFLTPLNIPAAGTYTLKTWATNANGLGNDNNTSNDTLVRTICTSIAGFYTIGGSGADYVDIASAVNALTSCGISGPVTFSINPGVYYGGYTIGNIPGGSATNTVSFNSITGIAGDVVLVHDTSSLASTNRSHFTINTDARVSFQNLKFERQVVPTVSAQGVITYGAAASGDVISCIIEDITGSTSSSNNGIIYRGEQGIFLNNTFKGFYYPLRLEGPSVNPYRSGNLISNNIFTDYTYRAIYAQNQNDVVISGNSISAFKGTSSFGAGIWTSTTYGAQVSENHIFGEMPQHGILISNPNADTLDASVNPNRYFNNVINGTLSSTITSTTVGPALISVSASFFATNPPNPRDAVEIVNNTINYTINSTSTSNFIGGIYVTGGFAGSPSYARIRIANNIVQMGPATPSGSLPLGATALRFTDQVQIDSAIVTTNNYRLLGATLPPLVGVNTPVATYNTLADWQAASNLDSGSANVDPAFRSITTLVPSNVALDNRALPISYVPTDIQGTPRSLTTPDMGAYEFIGAIFSQIVHTPLADTLLGPNRVVTASITDSVSTLTPGSARLFYKKMNQSAWLVDTLPTITGNNYSFIIDTTALGGLQLLDTIQYYIAISNATTTVTTSPLGGDGLQPGSNIPPSTLHAYRILPILSGTYRVGTSGPADFATLTQAATFYNSAFSIAGPVNFLLIDTLYAASTGETFPINFIKRSGGSATNTVTIKPDTGVNALIVGAQPSGSGLITLRGVEFFNIDGSNNGTTSRNLKIQSNSVADNNAAIYVRSVLGNSIRNVTIQNVDVVGGSRTVTSTFGITAVGAAISTFASGDSIENLTIRNVSAQRAYFGIYVRGTFANPATGVVIEGNSVGSLDSNFAISQRGIDVNQAPRAIIRNNEVFNISNHFAFSLTGIEVGGTLSDSLVVTQNKVWGIRSRLSSGTGAYGINASSGVNIIIANNVVYDIRTTNVAFPQSQFSNAHGIRLTGGTDYGIYYNSVHLFGTYDADTAGTRAATASAFTISSTTVSGDIRNNVFSNQISSIATEPSYFTAMWFPTGTTFGNFTLNNNAYHVDTTIQHFVGRRGTSILPPDTYTTVQDWKNITSSTNQNNDNASVPPQFNEVAPFTSNTDLTVPVGTITGIESGAVVIASLGTPNIDFTGTARPAGTGIAPDMGAYEINGIMLPDAFPPIIDSFTVTPRLGQCLPVSRAVTVYARDNAGGVGIDSITMSLSIAGVAQPNILLTRTSGTALNGEWTGTIPAATAPNERIVASVVARDSNANFSSVRGLGSFTDDYLTPNAGPNDTITAGDTAILNGQGGLLEVTLGTGTTVNTTTGYPAPYGNWYWGARHQFLILASELQAQGVGPGAIESLEFDVVTPSGTALSDFSIRMGNTTQTSMTTWEPNTTLVYNVPTFTDVAGWNLHAFTTPYLWDGSSNLVVEVCFQNGNFTTNSIVNQTTTSFTSSLWFRQDAAGTCTNTSITGTSSDRPNMKLRGGYPFTWKDLSTGTVISSTQQTLPVTPLVTTDYEFTLIDGACSKSDTMTVVVLSNNIMDVGIVQIMEPVAPQIGQPSQVMVVVQNHGNMPATGFDVGFAIQGSATDISTNAVSRTMQPGDTMHHIFSLEWTPTVGGDITLCAYTKGLAGDTNAANDTACRVYLAVSTEAVSNLLGRVYPNPADQFVKFELAGNEGVGTLEIRDNLGRVVLREQVDLSTGNVHEVKTETYAAGVYNYRFILREKVQHGQVVIRR